MKRRLIVLLIVLSMTGVISISSGCTQSSSHAEESRSLGDVIDDATITASVKIALAFKPGVSAIGINVDTHEGVVTLHGEVGNEAERQLAAMVAEDVSNVKQVVNELRIRG